MIPPAPPPPRLRRDLDLHPAEPDPDGAPAWVIHDPLAGRYFRIGAREADLLALVDGRPAASLAEAALARFGHRVAADTVEGLFAFLRAHHLVIADEAQRLRFRQDLEQRPGWVKRLTKSYISFRLPLTHPDRFLTATLPWVAWLGARPVLVGLAVLALAGLYLVSRQMDAFLTTFAQFASVQGVIAYGLVIVVVKTCHELGHAYAAKARGLRVPSMGVTFIVFWPVAYTDTSDAWRLRRRGERLTVGLAGVAVELGIAALSLFLWNLTPDGPLRGLLFLLATTTWILSLMVNLNPFMRFDGYFLFADLTRMPNLEARGHAMGRWFLRRLLFGWPDPPPDPAHRWLIAYAWAVWLYRLVLFTGIALAVYHLFFKALGIVLFAVEMVYFVLAPMAREVRAWMRRRAEGGQSPAAPRTLVLLALALAGLLLPWRAVTVAPALIAAESVTLYAPEKGRLETLAVRHGQWVEAGRVLATLAAPDLAHDLEQAVRRHDERVFEQAALGVDDLRRERALVIAAQLDSQKRLIAALRARLGRLNLEAPHAGWVVDVEPGLGTGQWLGAGQRLLAVAAPRRRITAYVEEAEVSRLSIGGGGTFRADDDLGGDLPVIITDIDPVEAKSIDQPYMMSSHGGPLDVRKDHDGTAVPVRALYRVHLRLATEGMPTAGSTSPQVTRGWVRLDARAEAPLAAGWRRLVALLRRESGL